MRGARGALVWLPAVLVAGLLGGAVGLGGAGARGERAAFTVTSSATGPLADGQRITLRGTKPFAAAVEVRLCPAAATSLTQCGGQSVTPPMERASRWRLHNFVAHRFVTVGSREYDCARTPCAVAVADINGALSTAIVASVPLVFRRARAPQRPNFTVEPAADLPRRAVVTVTATGFAPYASVNVQQCHSRLACVLTSGGYTAQLDGSITLPAPVSRFLRDGSGRTTDCARLRGCLLSLVTEPAGGRTPRPVRIHFLDEPPARQPSIELAVTEGLTDRQTVEVTISNPRRDYQLWQCPAADAARPNTERCRGLDSGGFVRPPPTEYSTGVLLRRVVLLHDTGEVLADCTTTPGACAVVLTSGGLDRADDIVPISFVPDTPEVPATLTVRGNGALAPGQARAILRGFDEDLYGTLQVSQCPPSFDPASGGRDGCVWAEPVTSAGVPGLSRMTVNLRRYVGGPDPVDCTTSPEPCWLVADNEYREQAAVALAFTPLSPEPTPSLAVAPSVGLADGDPVAVTMTGPVPGGAAPSVVLCPQEVARHSVVRGPNPCRRLVLVDPQRAGSAITATVYPPRVAGTRQEPVDCASAACELLLWVGSFRYDRQPVAFDATTPILLPDLQADLPAAGLADGEVVSGEVTGRSRGWIGQCVADSRSACRLLARFAGAPAGTTEPFELVVRREVGAVDCGARPGRCELSFFSRDHGAPVALPIWFDTSEELGPPRLRLSQRDELADGQELDVTVINSPDEGYGLFQCLVVDRQVAQRSCRNLVIGSERAYQRTHTVTVQRFLEVDAQAGIQPYDCASVARSCAVVMRAYDGGRNRIARLTFAPT